MASSPRSRKRGLPLHDRARDLEQRLVADLEAADQPAGFLELRAQRRIVGRARDDAGVALVDAQPRHRAGVQFDRPALVGPAHEHVGHDVFGTGALERGTRARMTAPDQRERHLHRLFVRAEQCAAVPRHSRFATACRWSRAMLMARSRPGVSGSSCASCSVMHSETLRAPIPAGSSVCTNASTSSTSVDRHGQFVGQALRDFLERLGQVAVVVERVDDGFADPQLPRIERADLELPDQVLMQIAAAFVGELERTVIVVGARAIARRASCSRPTGRPSRR